jgi:hypothetical protein
MGSSGRLANTDASGWARLISAASWALKQRQFDDQPPIEFEFNVLNPNLMAPRCVVSILR